MPAVIPIQEKTRCLTMFTTIITFIFYSILYLKHFCPILSSKPGFEVVQHKLDTEITFKWFTQCLILTLFSLTCCGRLYWYLQFFILPESVPFVMFQPLLLKANGIFAGTPTLPSTWVLSCDLLCQNGCEWAWVEQMLEKCFFCSWLRGTFWIFWISDVPSSDSHLQLKSIKKIQVLIPLGAAETQ